MKRKVAIAILLVLMILSTVAVPVFADSARGKFIVSGIDGSGSYSLRTTKDYRIKVTATLKGLPPGVTFYCFIRSGYEDPTGLQLISVSANERGVAKFTITTPDNYPISDEFSSSVGPVTIDLFIRNTGDTIRFTMPTETLVFNKLE